MSKLTLEQKKQIEQEILKCKSPHNDKFVFIWNENDTVHFEGSLIIHENVEFKAPNLTTIGGYLRIHKNVEFKAPNLTTVGGPLIIFSNADFKAPNLKTVGGYLRIHENADFKAPNLTTVGGYIRTHNKVKLTSLTNVGGYINIHENSEFKAPNLTTVGKSIYIHSNVELTSLKTIGGYLDIYNNAELTSLTSVGGSLDIYNNAKIPNLKTVGGYLRIHENADFKAPNLTNIGGSLIIRSNVKLNSLKTIGGYIRSYSNVELTSLKTIGGDVGSYWKSDFKAPNLKHKDFIKGMKQGEELHGFIKADNISLQFIKKRKQGKHTIYITPFKHSNYSYVITDGEHYAHCRDIRQGILDIKFKSTERDMSKYRDLGLGHELTYDEAVTMYRVITGACSGGTQQFLDNHPELTDKKKYTIQEISDITSNEYGSRIFANFFK